MNNEIEYLAFKCAVIGFVYSQILTDKEQILNSLYRFLDRHIGKYPIIFKPIIDCYKCVTGQIFLWSFIVLSYYDGSIVQNKFTFQLIYGITLSIFISIILNYINERTKKT